LTTLIAVFNITAALSCTNPNSKRTPNWITGEITSHWERVYILNRYATKNLYAFDQRNTLGYHNSTIVLCSVIFEPK